MLFRSDLVRKIAENYRLPYYTMSPTYSVCATHGYLTGEQKVCPICGKTTEVYSRITGYYRPVQNWNDGKAQEFKDRKVYNVGASRMIRKKRADIAAGTAEEALREAVNAEPAAEAVPEEKGAALRLFATTTCPNCKIVAAQMDKMGIEYRKIYADQDPAEAKALGIRKAPTLVVGNDEARYTGVADIRKFLETLQVKA